MRVPIGVPGGGVRGRVQGGGGSGFSCEKEGEGKGKGVGWGGGWGPAKELASQCASFLETTL